MGETTIGIRHVVTGHDNADKAVIASDDMIEPITIDYEYMESAGYW